MKWAQLLETPGGNTSTRIINFIFWAVLWRYVWSILPPDTSTLDAFGHKQFVAALIGPPFFGLIIDYALRRRKQKAQQGD